MPLQIASNVEASRGMKIQTAPSQHVGKDRLCLQVHFVRFIALRKAGSIIVEEVRYRHANRIARRLLPGKILYGVQLLFQDFI